MGTNEFIALFMITGVVSLGVSVSLYKYTDKAVFLIACLGFVSAYTFLMSESLYIRPDMQDVYASPYKSANIQNYISTAFVAIIYLILGTACSYLYAHIRKEKKRKGLGLVSFVIWGILTALLYNLVASVDTRYVYFNTCASMFLIPAIVITMVIIPLFMSLIPPKE